MFTIRVSKISEVQGSFEPRVVKSKGDIQQYLDWDEEDWNEEDWDEEDWDEEVWDKKNWQKREAWRAIKNMRNMFAHDYNSMDIELIWETVVEDIPELKAFCEECVRKFL